MGSWMDRPKTGQKEQGNGNCTQNVCEHLCVWEVKIVWVEGLKGGRMYTKDEREDGREGEWPPPTPDPRVVREGWGFPVLKAGLQNR